MARQDGWEIWRAFLGWFRPAEEEVSTLRFAGSDGLELVSAAHALIDPAANFDETVEEVDEAELLDFLAADLDPVPADPEFREDLRERLWTLVQDGVTALPKDH